MSEEKDIDESELDDLEYKLTWNPIAAEEEYFSCNPQRLSKGCGLCKDCGEKVFKERREYENWWRSELDGSKDIRGRYVAPEHCENCLPKALKIFVAKELIELFILIGALLALIIWAYNR